MVGLYQVVTVIFSRMVDSNKRAVYNPCMTNQISKKISLRSAQITRMLDEAECLLLNVGQTLDDEAWMLESLMNGIRSTRRSRSGQ